MTFSARFRRFARLAYRSRGAYHESCVRGRFHLIPLFVKVWTWSDGSRPPLTVMAGAGRCNPIGHLSRQHPGGWISYRRGGLAVCTDARRSGPTDPDSDHGPARGPVEEPM